MRRVAKKGQIALEAMIIIGFIFLLMIPLLYMLFSRALSIQDEFNSLEATRAMDALASTVSTVGVIGPNGTAVIQVTFPDNMENITIGDAGPGTSSREIVAVVSTTLGNIDIVRVVPYEVNGTINTKQGSHNLRITYYDTGLPIQISNA